MSQKMNLYHGKIFFIIQKSTWKYNIYSHIYTLSSTYINKNDYQKLNLTTLNHSLQQKSGEKIDFFF